MKTIQERCECLCCTSFERIHTSRDASLRVQWLHTFGGDRSPQLHVLEDSHYDRIHMWGWVSSSPIRVSFIHHTKKEELHKQLRTQTTVPHFIFVWDEYSAGILFENGCETEVLLPHEIFRVFTDIPQNITPIRIRPESFVAELANYAKNFYTRMKFEIFQKGYDASLVCANIQTLQKFCGETNHLNSLDSLEKWEDSIKTLAQLSCYGLFAIRSLSKDTSVFCIEQLHCHMQNLNNEVGQTFCSVLSYPKHSELLFLLDEICVFLQKFEPQKNILSEEQDSVIHLYEYFLHHFHQSERSFRGVFYTPAHVVCFIIDGIHETLKKNFSMSLGIASVDSIGDSLTNVEKNLGVKQSQIDRAFVQILDPAMGTGVFLLHLLRKIRSVLYEFWSTKGYTKDVIAQEWCAYVSGTKGNVHDYTGNGLLSRIFGFEYLPTPYFISHFRIGALLAEDDLIPYYFQPNERLHFYRCDSLSILGEEILLSIESQRARAIATQTDIRIVIGNPPYSGISSSKNSTMTQLVEDYKYIDGVYFSEKKHWLNDDYVQFIRLAQYYISRSGFGVLGFITPHGFLDNPSFRAMRWKLLQDFSEVFVVNLHGNIRKKRDVLELDENIFPIQQGVSIQIMCHYGQSCFPNNKVQYSEKKGSKLAKLHWLKENTLSTIDWEHLDIRVYNKIYDGFYFVPKNVSMRSNFQNGISIEDIFLHVTSGIVTARDTLVIDFHKESLLTKITHFSNLSIPDDEIRSFYFANRSERKYPKGDTRGWKLSEQRKNIAEFNHKMYIQKLSYRPFDIRFVYYCSKMVDWGRESVMKHIIDIPNFSFVFKRGDVEPSSAPVFVSAHISDFRYWSCPGMQGGDYVAPVFWVDSSGIQWNIHPKTMKYIWNHCGFSMDEETWFMYMYGVLHIPSYRKQYKDFLSSEVPRIPFPPSKEKFVAIAEIGKILVELHLFQSIVHDNTVALFRYDDSPCIGEALVKQITVTAPKKTVPKTGEWNGKIWISKHQYFSFVPQEVWNKWIGGYQPARKWLKDRNGQLLSSEEIQHYSTIIYVLKKTIEWENKLNVLWEH